MPWTIGCWIIKATTPLNIKSGFRATGIEPFDENVFTEEDFLPSSVTDRPQVNPLVNEHCSSHEGVRTGGDDTRMGLTWFSLRDRRHLLPHDRVGVRGQMRRCH